MRVPETLVAVGAVFATSSSAQLITSTQSSTTLEPSGTEVSSIPVPTGANACAIVSSLSASFAAAESKSTSLPMVPASTALECLQSVPLDVQRSSAFVDYVSPYLEFQSTLAYLKDPPTGYVLPGVDIFGGLAEIKLNLQNGVYKSQWDFETDLYALVNIMPHDFHITLQLPLISVFQFKTGVSLASVSTDGLILPEVFFKNDILEQLSSNSTLNWKPSPLVSIDGKSVSDYLQKVSVNVAYHDPDAMWNLLFPSVPFSQQNSGNNFDGGIYQFGIPNDMSSYSLANGTTLKLQNYAFVAQDFSGIDSGAALFSTVDLPPTTTAAPPAKRSDTATPTTTPTETTTATASAVVAPGGLSPVVIHSDGFIGGFFLDAHPDTAVLFIYAFADSSSSIPGNAEMQKVIEEFLANCTASGKTKLIIDLSSNGGGSVFNGYDAFKQLFPAIEPFGGSRLRSTPLVDYLGKIFSASGVYDAQNQSIFQTQSTLDVNLKPFPSWPAEDPPVLIYGDNFTTELRYNLSDPFATEGNGIDVSGYLNKSQIAPSPFTSENIVMIEDGTCGSTCAVFSEFMKSQGNVRSIAVGGRPQTGPMQGVTGSKGSQVLTYKEVFQYVSMAPGLLKVLASKGIDAPPQPPAQFALPQDYPPLGPAKPIMNAGVNIRNGYTPNDASNTPLEFVYEAANCRLFYKAEDLVDVSALWNRVANVAWGNGTCVPGSTINSDNTISSAANATVPFDPKVKSNVTFPSRPGSLNGSSTSSASPSGTSSVPGASATKNGAGSLKVTGVLFAVVMSALVACL